MEDNEPLKVVEDKDDFSISMKLEVYPNRNSLVYVNLRVINILGFKKNLVC